jgi:phosphotriesterase-related protein
MVAVTGALEGQQWKEPCRIGLIDRGFIDQILISQDLCWKHRLRSYGGHGYDHILRNVIPVMRAKGISEDRIHTLLVRNPKRLLTFQ